MNAQKRTEHHVEMAWSDDDGVQDATGPIDADLNSRSVLFQALDIIIKEQEKIRHVSDLAFEAVDADNSNSLDTDEL